MTPTIAFSALPPLNSPLDIGIFSGVTTRKDGTHCAAVLLPGSGVSLTWDQAMAWAKEQGGELPTRPVDAMLFDNAKPALSPEWHWTADESDASYAWDCCSNTGFHGLTRKSYEGGAVAVRLIPITA